MQHFIIGVVIAAALLVYVPRVFFVAAALLSGFCLSVMLTNPIPLVLGILGALFVAFHR